MGHYSLFQIETRENITLLKIHKNDIVKVLQTSNFTSIMSLSKYQYD